MDTKKHWETIYRTRPTSEVSWFQPEAKKSLELIRRVAPERAAPIVDVGGGASGWARFHLNGEYTFGARLGAGEESNAGAAEVSSWLGGIAVDRTFPLKALLVSGELYAREPIATADDLEWNTGIGLRYQLDPRFNIDGGIGRRLTGDDRGWYVTFGTAYAVGLPWRR